MKTNRPTHPTPRRRSRHTPPPERRPDPLQQQAAERRLYTDFLALCLYPGMERREPTGHAA